MDTRPNPDVVVFDRFMVEEQFGWRVEKACPNALRVLDTSDLHCLREARQQHVLKGVPYDLYNELALREIASIHRCDLSLMISRFEMDLLEREFSIPGAQLAYWPFSVDLAEAVFESFEPRQHFVMIGSLMHAPNLDAAVGASDLALLRKQLPDVELHCYGSYGEKYAAELHAPEHGFYFKGRARCAANLAAAGSIAPLRFGAGLKGKSSMVLKQARRL